MSKTFQNQRTFFLLGVLFSFSVAVIYGVGLEVPVISDEVVTLANGEFLLGNDWSYLVAATGSLYYKWFYGVFVMPILWAFHNPYIAYRIIMIINGLLQASIMPVCYLICRRHLGLDQTLYAVLISICVTFVPSAFLYSFYARGDIFLNVIPWFVLLSLLEGMKADREARKAKKAIFTLVATVLSMIAFLAHVRGVVVIIAMVLTALLVRLFIKRSPINWMLLIVMLLILFVADSAISAFFKGALYWVEGTRANTLENMPLTSFFDIFSFGMLKDMIAMLSAWGFTLFSTSYGLVPLGVLACAAVCISAFLKKTKIKDAEKLAAIFSLLVFVGYIMVGLLLFKGTFYALKYGDLDRRVDRLLYDRYSYCGISLVVFWAVYAIAVRPERLTGKLRLVTLVLSTATLGMFFWKCYPLAVRFPGYLYNTITLNTFSEIEDPWEILWGGFYTSRMLFGALALGGGGFLLILLFSGRRHSVQQMALFLAFVVLAQLALVQCNYRKIRKPTNDIVVESTAPVVELIGSMDPITEEYPYVLKYGGNGVKIQFYQAQLPTVKMIGPWEREMVGDNYLVVCSPEDILSLTEEGDIYCFTDVDYENEPYDAVYVYGEALRQALERAGYDFYAITNETG